MNIETLRLFCSAVQQGNLSRAAAANGVSQSAATQSLHRLESHLGVCLLDRSKRPFVVTAEGQVCYDGFRQVLEAYEATEDRVRSVRQDVSGRVRVAAIYSVGLHGLTQGIRQFMRRHPRANVHLEYLRPPEVLAAVEEGTADLGIVSYPAPSPQLHVISLPSERMLVACHPRHRLSQLRAVPTATLKNEDFVAFDRELPIRREIDKCLRAFAVPVNVVLEFDNVETIKQAVEIDAGISILPEPTIATEVAMGRLAAVRLLGAELRRPIGIVHLQRKVLSPTVAAFIELLVKAPATTSSVAC